MSRILRFLRKDDGPTAVEYAVLLAGILIVCLAAVTMVGGEVVSGWDNNKTELEDAFAGK